MSMLLELAAAGRKAGHVCHRDYRRGIGCPLLVRTTSEDVLTANVFGTLRHLRPSLWLRPMLAYAFHTKQFASCSMTRLRFDFWHPVPPPPMRAHIEGMTEVDMLIRFGGTSIFVETKYNAALATRTKHDAHRDQLARLLDVAWCSTSQGQLLTPPAPFVLVVGIAKVEPPLLTSYRDPRVLAGALDHHRRYPQFRRDVALLASRIGYCSWSALADLTDAHASRATRAERPFLSDVTTYIRHKVATAGRPASQPMLPLVEDACARKELR